MNMNKEFLQQLRNERTTYRDMIDFCCDSLILNNYIVKELSSDDYYFDFESGSDVYYEDENGNEISYEEYERLIDEGKEAYENYLDIYQYYLISAYDAERLERYTNEIVMYCEKLDLYVLCVTHFGTVWTGVPANWKKDNEYNEED